MKIYSQYSRCRKCGSTSISTEYSPRKVMVRKCARCGYRWEERPLDKEEDDGDIIGGRENGQ